jgi:hypothetical protein
LTDPLLFDGHYKKGTILWGFSTSADCFAVVLKTAAYKTLQENKHFARFLFIIHVFPFMCQVGLGPHFDNEHLICFSSIRAMILLCVK